MVKTRIQFKTDTASNWENIETSFEGLPGEILVYSNYEDTGRVNHLGNKIYIPNIKIGKENKKLVKQKMLSAVIGAIAGFGIGLISWLIKDFIEKGGM